MNTTGFDRVGPNGQGHIDFFLCQAGFNVRRAKDDTLFALTEGTVIFRGRKVHVQPADESAMKPAWMAAGA